MRTHKPAKRYLAVLLLGNCGQKYVNRRTSRRTSGERQVKPRRKFVNLKVVSYIQKHNKTVIPKMKTKRKEKEKKEEKKRSEEKKVCLESISRPSTYRA